MIKGIDFGRKMEKKGSRETEEVKEMKKKIAERISF